LALSCCAPPQPSIPDSHGFVTEQELSTVRAAQLGEQYFRQGRFVEAEMQYRKALSRFPTADNLRESFALVIAANGQEELAIDELERLSAKYPNSYRYVVRIAEILLKSGDSSSALRYLSRAGEVAKSVNDIEGQIYISRLLSHLYFAQGAEQEALCASHDALELSNYREQQKIEHAKVLMAMNRFKDAVQLFPAPATDLAALKENDDILIVRALAAFNAKDLQQVKGFKDQGEVSGIDDPKVKAEISLIDRCLEPQKEDQTSEELEESLSGIPQLKSINQLQWPIELYECWNKLIESGQKQ